MAMEAMQVVYPQIPIEDERDVDLLWTEEMEMMSLSKMHWSHELDSVNFLDRKKEKVSAINRIAIELANPIPLHSNEIYRRALWHLNNYNYINGETIFYEIYPDWFNYMVLGKDFLARQSKIRKFSFFTPFQVDYQRAFLDYEVYRMGVTANRGGAKSWLMTDCSIVDASIHPGVEMSILSGSEKQGENTYAYALAMAKDETCGIHDLIEGTPTKKEILFKPRTLDGMIDYENGIISKIFNQAAAETAVRGPRATKIVFDEVTQIPPDLIDSTIGQSITSPSIKIIWGGTPDDPGHTAHTDWWCTPPDSVMLRNGKTVNCNHWINHYPPDPDISWHLFHWDAYDCHVDKGGWITEKAIQVLKATYRSHSKQRREIYGKWTSSEGNIFKMEDIEASMKMGQRDFSVRDLPKRFDMYTGFIISVDGARHRHYSTVSIIGFKNYMAEVIYTKGWDNIKEPSLRKKVLRAVSIVKDNGGRNVFLVVEDAPISSTLIDNLREECSRRKVRFYVSTFKHNKLNMVDHIIDYFETGMIKICKEFSPMIDELFIYRWGKNVDQKGRRLPEKGNDDFVDGLIHGLWADKYIFAEAGLGKGQRKKGKVDKLFSGTSRPEKRLVKTIARLKRQGFHRNRRIRGI
jgi:hypothetical protein